MPAEKLEGGLFLLTPGSCVSVYSPNVSSYFSFYSIFYRSPLSPVLPVSTKIYMTSFEDYKKNYHDIKKIAEVCMFKYIVVNVFVAFISWAEVNVNAQCR